MPSKHGRTRLSVHNHYYDDDGGDADDDNGADDAPLKFLRAATSRLKPKTSHERPTARPDARLSRNVDASPPKRDALVQRTVQTCDSVDSANASLIRHLPST